MAAIRNYTHTGTINWTTTSPVGQGGFCYVGNGKFAVCSQIDTTIYLLDINGKVVSLSSTIATANGTVAGLESNRAGQVIVTIRRDVPTRNIWLVAYDLSRKTVQWEQSFTPTTGEGGIAFNGNQWWISYTDATVPTPVSRMALVSIPGAGGTAERTINVANFNPAASFIQDFCFDGLSLWTIQGSNLLQYEVEGKQLPTLQKSFALTGANPLGVTTDGHSLFVLSRN